MAAQSPTAAVTVVIPHYGDPAPTLALVDRLLTDPGDALAAVVVSDDASPTPYPEAHDPRLTVVRRERNGGFGANVNTGLAAVTTELALVLNSDAEITGAQIDALVAAAAPYQPAVVSPQVVNEDGTPQWSGRHFPTVLHQTVEWLTPLARFRHLDVLHEAVGHDVAAARSASPVAVDWVMGAVLLLPMAQVRAVGGFDEEYFMNSEEVDCSAACASAACRRSWSRPSVCRTGCTAPRTRCAGAAGWWTPGTATPGSSVTPGPSRPRSPRPPGRTSP